MLNQQKYTRFPVELFYIVLIFSVLFLLSFWWKIHGISVKLQNEYQILKNLDDQTLHFNLTEKPPAQIS